MQNTEQVLQNMIRIARSGRDFFRAIYPRVNDPEVRMAFTYVTDVKSRLIDDLSKWLPQVEDDGTDRTSPAATVERIYTEARRNFRGDAPAETGNALAAGEVQLCRLLERAFEETKVPALKRLLKAYYSELMLCRQAMWRLQARRAA